MNPELINAARRIQTSKRELVMQILTVFVFPVALIVLGFIPIEKRVLVLIVLVSLLLAIIFTEKWTFQMLGVTRNGIRKYLLPYAIFTGIVIVLITQLGKTITGTENLNGWWQHQHFLYLFFIVSFFQEIAYRGYLVPALVKLNSKPHIVFLYNVILFVLLHAIFPNPLISLSVALVGGIGFTFMYMRYPSLPLIIVSHAILNFFAVMYGFFVIPGMTY